MSALLRWADHRAWVMRTILSYALSIINTFRCHGPSPGGSTRRRSSPFRFAFCSGGQRLTDLFIRRFHGVRAPVGATSRSARSLAARDQLDSSPPPILSRRRPERNAGFTKKLSLLYQNATGVIHSLVYHSSGADI